MAIVAMLFSPYSDIKIPRHRNENDYHTQVGLHLLLIPKA
ncbi:hypothetical protein ALTERO38_60673 [Alteromonas sp. 38]|nr:hypothetical protein ALTER154_40121 [Alteromonas sp. 154]VXC29771.1 hypothetical protein ALTERO38_60673 [Alteromonas sp. 38]